ERVSKVYPGVVPVPALTDVSLRVFAGDILAIEGPSGSGKSTLLGLLGLLDVPTEGQVYIDGVEGASRGEIGRTLMRRDTLGFVFQQFHLVEHLNAQENVEMALLFRGLSMTRRRSIASAMLERVGLENRLDHAP